MANNVECFTEIIQKAFAIWAGNERKFNFSTRLHIKIKKAFKATSGRKLFFAIK